MQFRLKPHLIACILLANSAFAQKSDSLNTAIFAGGSFWSLDPVFEKLPGVDSAVTGYTGGHGPNPTFENVSSGYSAYMQAVKVYFNPKRISYAQLLDTYWRNIDPTREDGQFTDEGPQFRTIIFPLSASQLALAEASRKRLRKSKRFSKKIVTEITMATTFHPAEAEHQDYYKKNKERYNSYVKFSGREAYLRKVWGAKRK